MNQIKKIYWQRANIIIEFDKLPTETSIYLINENKEKIQINNSDNIIEIKITNTPEEEMLKPGKWKIEVDKNSLKINEKIIEELDALTRVFKYRKDFYAYIVTFDFNENKELFINTEFMMKNRKYKKKILISEGNTIKQKIFIIVKIIAFFFINIFYKLFSIINKKNDILFLTENEENIKGNLELIYNQINLSNKKIFSKNIYVKKYNKFNYIKELYYISKAKYIIIDNYVKILNLIDLSKQTKIIQTWHAGLGFKAVGYARFGKNAGPHPIYSSHRKNDYVIVDDEKLVNIYQEVFGIKKDKVIPCGIPRLENYLDQINIEKTSKELINKYPILNKKKVILFAPTYRGNGHNDAYYDINKLDLNEIEKFCIKNNFVFVIKMHPFINKKLIKTNNYANIIQLEKENINDLIYISDILITDYSSCAYEFSLFNRPIIFFRYDKEFYEKERPLHTLETFSKKQYEVINQKDILKILNELKDLNINERFSNINKRNNKSIETIKNIISGE